MTFERELGIKAGVLAASKLFDEELERRHCSAKGSVHVAAITWYQSVRHWSSPVADVPVELRAGFAQALRELADELENAGEDK